MKTHETERRPLYYTVSKGTTIRTGPLGGYSSDITTLEDAYTVRLMQPSVVMDGYRSLNVVFAEKQELPNHLEQLGSFWISQHAAGGPWI